MQSLGDQTHAVCTVDYFDDEETADSVDAMMARSPQTQDHKLFGMSISQRALKEGKKMSGADGSLQVFR